MIVLMTVNIEEYRPYYHRSTWSQILAIFKRKIVIDFLSISLNMCFGSSKEPSVGSGGGGASLINNIYVGLGFIFLISIFLWVFTKMNIFGYYDFCGCFLFYFLLLLFFFFGGGGGRGSGHNLIRLFWGHSRVCFKVNVQNGNMWWGIVKLQIFFGYA